MRINDRRRSPAIQKILLKLSRVQDEWIALRDILPSYCGPRTELGKISKADREHRRVKDIERNRLAYLKRKQWIKCKRTERGIFVALTQKGEQEWSKRLNVKNVLPKGQWCLVIWDIPEVAKNGRNRLRYFLKRNGFVQQQRSVWISRFDVMKEMKELIRSTGLQQWVSVYLAKES